MENESIFGRKKLCEMKPMTLIDGRACKDHIHMYVAVPPQMSVSEFIQI